MRMGIDKARRGANGNRRQAATLALIFGMAAFCPAPIKDYRSGLHELPQHSAAQRHEELKYNGTSAVVGSVPEKTNQDGTGPDPVTGDSKARSIIAARPITSDPAALRSLATVNRRIQQQAQQGDTPWLAGILVFLGAIGAVQLMRVWLSNHGPAPRRVLR
jgi:hypothetical protein